MIKFMITGFLTMLLPMFILGLDSIKIEIGLFIFWSIVLALLFFKYQKDSRKELEEE